MHRIWSKILVTWLGSGSCQARPSRVNTNEWMYLVKEPYIPFSLNCSWYGTPTRLLPARCCKMPHIKRIQVNDFQFLGGLHDFHCNHLTLTPHSFMWSYLKYHVFHNKTCKLTYKRKYWKWNQAICKSDTHYQQHAMPHPDVHGAHWWSLPANKLMSICSRWNKVCHHFNYQPTNALT